MFLLQIMLNTVLLVSAVILTVQAVKLEVTNLEIGPIWVGIKGTEGKDIIDKGGFELKSSESVSSTQNYYFINVTVCNC